MAIYHLSHGIVSRSSGRSSVQSAAYITGTQLHETRRNLNISYQNRHSDIAFTDTLAPKHAPQQFHNLNVWDNLENFEDAYAVKRFPNCLKSRNKYLNSAQTAQTIVMALPRELEVSIAKELVEEFALTRFVSRGLIVTYAIHDDEGNPHAHLQISRHAVNAKGELIWAKDREIVRRKSLLATRTLWANLSNQYLEREGFDARITEKSYADLGINLEPTRHRGWIADKLGAIGINSYVVAENAAIFAHNQATLIANPAAILPEITSQTATFTQTQLLKAIQKRIGDDDKVVASVFEAALQQAIVVGEGIDGQIRYTTQTYQDLEAEAIKTTSALINTPFAQDKLSNDSNEAYLAANFAYLSKSQKDAVLGLTQNQSLAVLIGRAGAGKTTTLKAVCQIYQNAGHRVIGTALSAMAAENLAQETGIKTATLHSWLYKWERSQSAQAKFLSFTNVMEEGLFKQLDWYQDLKRFESARLTKDTVLILDEAGMVGTLQWGELLKQVQNAGAKLIVAGDDHQFKAIAAGDFFREIKHQAESQTPQQSQSRAEHQSRQPSAALTNPQEHCQNIQIQTPHLFNLKEIRRQQYSWMQEASHQLAELNIQAGLSIYEQRGHIHQTNYESLNENIATAYLQKLKAGFGEPQTGLVLAFTNAQTNTINQAIREQLKQNGIIGKEDLFELNGHSFARNDRIVFLKNTKTLLTVMDANGMVQPEKAIKNGTQGWIMGVDKQGNIKIQLTDNCYTIINAINTLPKVAIGQPQAESTRNYTYTQITHGYAVTTHKAQGQTVDFAIIAASKHMDAKGLYVAMTRHRDDVQLFYAKEDFASFKALTNQLSRFESKDLVKDYTIRPESEAAWQRVQEYKLCTLDAAYQIAEIRGQSAESNGINQFFLKSDSCNPGSSPGQRLNSDSWQTYHQIKQDQINLAKEILQDFKAHQLYINQAGLTQEMLQITTGQKARPLSTVETKAKITVELYGEMAHLAREIWHNIRKTHPGSKCYSHPDYAKFNEVRQERNALAQTISDNYPLHREFVTQLSRTYGINRKTVEAQQCQFKQHQTIEQSPEKSRQTQDNHHIVDNHQKHYARSTNYQTQFQDEPSFIKQALNAKIKDLAYQLLGKPQTQKATEWRYGNKGSISIHVAGHKQGLYSNFETGESGNALKLIQDQLNLDHKQAFKWGVAWLGKDHPQSINRTAITQSSQQSPQAKPEWRPIFPAPNTNTAVNLSANRSLAYMLKATQEIARYAYKDADGHILGYVVRLENHQGHKITPTLTYCRNQEGKKQWRWQGFGNDRPLYGLEQLKQKPKAHVLIVEGEKTAEAAKALFPEYAVVTWNGGCGAVQKSDWGVLKDRAITIWPDNDQPGLNAAAKIADILRSQGNQSVKTVDLSFYPTLPHKWDLADRVPEGIDVKKVLTATHLAIEDHNHAKNAEQGQITYAQTTQAIHPTHPIDIATIRHICKNHYMGYRITHENTEFIIKVTNDTYKELQQWTRLSGFTKDDSKLAVQAALTAVYTDLAKTQMDKDQYNVHTNTLERAIDIGAIAGKSRMENPRSLADDLDVVQSAAKLHERHEKVIAELVAEKPATPDLTSVAKTAILKATFRCLSMTGFHISKEMSAKALTATKIVCGMENDSQKAQAAISMICEQLAKEAPPTIDRPLTIQEQRAKSVVDYINTQIITKSHPWIAESIIEIVKTQLGRDPLLALDTWKTLTKDDTCFTPLSFTEMQNKTQEATMWLERSKMNLTAEIHDKLQTTLMTNPEAVIQHCHKLQLQLDKTFQYDINKDYHFKSPYHDRDNSRAAKERQPLAKGEGDEKLHKEITSHPEIQTQTQRQLTEPKEPKINEGHRGFER